VSSVRDFFLSQYIYYLLIIKFIFSKNNIIVTVLAGFQLRCWENEYYSIEDGLIWMQCSSPLAEIDRDTIKLGASRY